MKGLTKSSLRLGAALAIGLVVVWLAAAPSVSKAHAVFGGTETSAEGCNCTGTTAGDCGSDCGSWALTPCDVGGSGPATCSCATPDNRCDDVDGCRYCDAACGT
jgi:hypothetical protein